MTRAVAAVFAPARVGQTAPHQYSIPPGESDALINVSVRAKEKAGVGPASDNNYRGKNDTTPERGADTMTSLYKLTKVAEAAKDWRVTDKAKIGAAPADKQRKRGEHRPNEQKLREAVDALSQKVGGQP